MFYPTFYYQCYKISSVLKCDLNMKLLVPLSMLSIHIIWLIIGQYLTSTWVDFNQKESEVNIVTAKYKGYLLCTQYSLKGQSFSVTSILLKRLFYLYSDKYYGVETYCDQSRRGVKDTKESSKTHPPASTSHGRFGPTFDQSKLFTSMLHWKKKQWENSNAFHQVSRSHKKRRWHGRTVW